MYKQFYNELPVQDSSPLPEIIRDKLSSLRSNQGQADVIRTTINKAPFEEMARSLRPVRIPNANPFFLPNPFLLPFFAL